MLTKFGSGFQHRINTETTYTIIMLNIEDGYKSKLFVLFFIIQKILDTVNVPCQSNFREKNYNWPMPFLSGSFILKNKLPALYLPGKNTTLTYSSPTPTNKC